MSKSQRTGWALLVVLLIAFTELASAIDAADLAYPVHLVARVMLGLAAVAVGCSFGTKFNLFGGAKSD